MINKHINSLNMSTYSCTLVYTSSHYCVHRLYVLTVHVLTIFYNRSGNGYLTTALAVVIMYRLGYIVHCHCTGSGTYTASAVVPTLPVQWSLTFFAHHCTGSGTYTATAVVPTLPVQWSLTLWLRA